MMTSSPTPAVGLARWPGPIAVVSVAQLLGTSMWFSANAAGESLMASWHASASDIGWLTSSVQAGFIIGTLLMSLTGIADRFKATSLFVVASLVGAVCNAAFAWMAGSLAEGLAWRFLVGIALAGIYPVGMKLLVSWAPERTGWALSLLVGMLTLGTALPHGLRWVGAGLDWRLVAGASSLLALTGAVLIGRLGDGPHSTRPAGAASAPRSGWATIVRAFGKPDYRAAALGYFGHMWELYAFWTVLPLLLGTTVRRTGDDPSTISGLAFLIIAAGTIGSVGGGWLSARWGSARIAAAALAASGLSGAIFLMAWRYLPSGALLALLLVWGATVVADSPHFSALSAKTCDPESVGTALAIQNSVGFAVTVCSISLVTSLFERIGPAAVWLLIAGPGIGLWLFRSLPMRRTI